MDDHIDRIEERLAFAPHEAFRMLGVTRLDISTLLDRLKAAEESVEWHQRRANLLQHWQVRMREPERTIVCDILANGTTLPDPDGKRYGRAALEDTDE